MVANGSEACLYSFSSPISSKDKLPGLKIPRLKIPESKLPELKLPKLKLIGKWLHPESRKKDLDMMSDKFGSFHHRGAGHSDFVEAAEPKKYEAFIFAKQLVHTLNEGRNANQYQDLILIASPEFLGLLHQQISKPLHNMVSQEIAKDYTKMRADHLLNRLHSGEQ